MLALTVVQRLVGLLRGVLFCRWLDPEQLGEWDMAFNFLVLAAPLAVLGLPGSFGRYVEHFRQRGQLKAFLRRTTTVSLLLTFAAVVAVATAPAWFSQFIFGTPLRIELTLWLAATLGVTIVFNFLLSLFTALRLVRVVSGMQFVSGLAFAGAGLGLLLGWRADATSVVIAFGLAYLASVVGCGWWLRQTWRALPGEEQPLAHRALWFKLAPFAISLWVTNWLSNTFEIVDRYVLVHFSGLEPQAALDLVGQYHSARLLPVLLIGVAEMLATLITPHLSCDWESGNRQAVSRRLNRIVKVFGLAMLGISAGVLVAAPLVFGWAFGGKFAAGQSILPWALACCMWTGLSALTYNYLWCAERSRYVSLSLAVGLVFNVALSLVLTPRYGLWGAVVSTTAAKLLSFMLVWGLACWQGLRFDRGLLFIAALPLCLPAGAWTSLALMTVVVASGVCFDPEERRDLASMARRIVDRYAPRRWRLARGRAG